MASRRRCERRGGTFSLFERRRVHEDEPVAPPAADETSIEPDVVVCVPDDEEVRRRIDITAAYVAEDGEPFERELKRRESSSEEFRFLFEHGV